MIAAAYLCREAIFAVWPEMTPIRPKSILIVAAMLGYPRFIELLNIRIETMSKDIADILAVITRERRMAVSDREWQHRLRGYGYGIRDTEEGRIVTSLIKDAPLCAIPAHLAA
ncbi:MAG: hypothetical protein WEB56_15735 [Roseovarius sp.]